MAILRNERLGRRIMLRPVHTLGRHPVSCRTVLEGADISKLHALVRWHAGRWEICDQSRNGTTVSGTRLATGQWTALEAGQTIAFGATHDEIWIVEDLEAPQVCLFPIHGDSPARPLNAQENLLPDIEHPEINLYCAEDRWVLDRMERVDVVVDGDTIQIADTYWEFVLAADMDATLEVHMPSTTRLPTLHFDFQISQNEEHASLDMRVGDHIVPLGERIHHYTLATLARKRLEDARSGIEPTSQGWIALEDLARMLGVDTPYINIQIFRARQQIMRALPVAQEATAILERRRGEVRFGAHAFRICKGATTEGAWPL
jgi:hypothetical protein